MRWAIDAARSSSGHGLSICRSIVDAHQGQIRAEAADDGGTSFRITLPAMERQAAVNE